MSVEPDDLIPFYGTEDRSLFAIERAAMDRQAKVIEYLRNHLPAGLILDIGAGDGFTAQQIQNNKIICMEPSSGMVNFSNHSLWVKGSAENIPFHDNYFDGAYSTWAYFLPGMEKSKGLEEALRVIKDSGKLIIVDNAGDDEFCSYAKTPIHEGPEFYFRNGFQREIIETAFEFENLQEAFALMSIYFPGSITRENIKQTYQYRVAAYTKSIQK